MGVFLVFDKGRTKTYYDGIIWFTICVFLGIPV